MDKYTISLLAQGDDQFLFTCLKKLYQNQTRYEQGIKRTYEVNGIGFNSFDAPVLTKYAKIIAKNLPLTISELKDLRKRIIKYSAQLTNYINDEDLP